MLNILIFIFNCLVYTMYIEYIKESPSLTTTPTQFKLFSDTKISYRRTTCYDFTHVNALILKLEEIRGFLERSHMPLCFFIIKHSEESAQCILKGKNRCDGNHCSFMCLKFDNSLPYVFIENETFIHTIECTYKLYHLGLRCVVFKVDDPFINTEAEGHVDITQRQGQIKNYPLPSEQQQQEQQDVTQSEAATSMDNDD